MSAQLTRDEADRLSLEPGRPVFVRPSRAKTFEDEPASSAAAEASAV